MKHSTKHYPIPTDLGPLQLTEKEIRQGYYETIKKWIDEFKNKHKEELKCARYLNFMNVLTAELQKIISDEKKFTRKLSAITNKYMQLEEAHMPMVVITYKTKGLEDAIFEFQDISLLYDSPDMRGRYRRKSPALSPDLVDEYEKIHSMLNQKIRPRYRSPIAKRMDIQELFPELTKDKCKEWNIDKLPKSEVAHRVLAIRHNLPPTTVRDCLTRSRPLSRLLKRPQ